MERGWKKRLVFSIPVVIFSTLLNVKRTFRLLYRRHRYY